MKTMTIYTRRNFPSNKYEDNDIVNSEDNNIRSYIIYKNNCGVKNKIKLRATNALTCRCQRSIAKIHRAICLMPLVIN